jgi:uncharacterized protein YeaO (DUF488 family)
LGARAFDAVKLEPLGANLHYRPAHGDSRMSDYRDSRPARGLPAVSLRGGRQSIGLGLARTPVLAVRRYPCAMSGKSRIRVARVYDDPDPDEGQRVLIDRLWPRGFRKDDPRVGTWCKDVAPSNELRGWYNHQPERFDEFAARYNEELQGSEALDDLRKLSKRGAVTLVTATRDVEISHAAVLAALLQGG